MCLKLYKRKRDFRQTPEPPAEVKRSTQGRIFVVQRHQSSILHYDLRIEVNGVLKSWAMPKGPSMNCNDRRLAIMVEDHPMSYATFKGTIPEGNYGAGTIERWDKGYFIPHGVAPGNSPDREILKGIKQGKIKFTLKGTKLKGVFTLLRFNGSDSNTWVLIKGNDKYAENGYPHAYESSTITLGNNIVPYDAMFVSTYGSLQRFG